VVVVQQLSWCGVGNRTYTPFGRSFRVWRVAPKKLGSVFYAGLQLRKTLKKVGKWTLEIIKRPDIAKGVEVLPRCWIAEPNFAWLNRIRRRAKDLENTTGRATAWLFVASVQLITRRITAAAGMKLGNLTYYFASNEDLLRKLFDAVIRSYEIEFDQIVHEAEATVEDRQTELCLLILADICTKKTSRISSQTLGALQPRPIRTGTRTRTLCACPNGAG
jgi:hypothetical protein